MCCFEAKKLHAVQNFAAASFKCSEQPNHCCAPFSTQRRGSQRLSQQPSCNSIMLCDENIAKLCDVLKKTTGMHAAICGCVETVSKQQWEFLVGNSIEHAVCWKQPKGDSQFHLFGFLLLCCHQGMCRCKSISPKLLLQQGCLSHCNHSCNQKERQNQAILLFGLNNVHQGGNCPNHAKDRPQCERRP